MSPSSAPIAAMSSNLKPDDDTIADDDTIDSSQSSEENQQTTFSNRLLKQDSLKKRSKKKKKKDPREDGLQRLDTKRRLYDIDGDGQLDKAELAMMRWDKDGDGSFSNQEVYKIIQEQLAARSDTRQMKKIVAGLACFVVILTLSNLGTSFASAILAQETKADTNTGTLRSASTNQVIAMQSTADTVELIEYTDEERRERRALVEKSLSEDPFGEHQHRRRLGKNKDKGNKKKGKIKGGDKINFDNGKMKGDIVDMIMHECEDGKTYNIKRNWDKKKKDKDGNISQATICAAGMKISKKGPKGPIGQLPKGQKIRIRLETKEGETDIECEGPKNRHRDSECHFSGSALLSGLGGHCNHQAGEADCEEGFICWHPDLSSTTGTCQEKDDLGRPWYVQTDHEEEYQCVQACEVGENCGGIQTNVNEMFLTAEMCCGQMFSYTEFGECVEDVQSANESDNY